MIPPDTLPLIWGLMIQACAKLYDEWREFLTSRPEIDKPAVLEALRGQLATQNFNLTSALDGRRESEALSSFIGSVEFKNFATDLVSFEVLGYDVRHSHELSQQLMQWLQVHGMSYEDANGASFVIIDCLAPAAELISSAFENAAGSKRTKKQAEKLSSAAYEQVRQRTATSILERISALTELLDVRHVNIRALERKTRTLRSSIIRSHEYLKLPSLQTVANIPIADLYVRPQFRSVGAIGFLHSDFTQSAGRSHRLVILGSPGAGKSTLTQDVALRAATQDAFAGTSFAMILVLRDHSDQVSDRGLDIIAAVKSTALEKYQVALDAAEIIFLCSSGRLFLIIDGLDELLDLRKRRAVATSLDAFSAVYERTPILVTCRKIGYELCPLNPRIFNSHELAPFSSTQMAEYVAKWFALDSTLDTLERKNLTIGFLSESDQISDLRENPLMLALLCGLYRTQRYLPRNRPAVYEECSKMLFDAWDKSRGLSLRFPFTAHINSAVQYLASWIFTSQERISGVPEAAIVSMAANYFEEWQSGNRMDAEATAQDFIDFCRGRAWILTDVGTDETGALFAFTHRTFLEYFTAKHAVRTSTEAELISFIISHACHAEWNIICQMIIQMSSDKHMGLGDRLILAVEGAHKAHDMDGQDVALSICLQSVVNAPFRPHTVARTIDACLRSYLPEPGVWQTRNELRSEGHRRSQNIWPGQSPVAFENRIAANQAAAALFGMRIRVTSDDSLIFLLLHAADYALANGTVLSCSDFLAQDIRELLTRKRLIISRQANAVTAAFLLGVDATGITGYTRSSTIDALLGPGGGINLVPSDYELNALPNILELCVLGGSDPSVLVDELKRRAFAKFAVAAVASFRASGRLFGPYNPHPTFWKPNNTVAGRTRRLSAGGDPASSLLHPIEVASAALCERYVEHVAGEYRRTRAEELMTRDWGLLDFMPQAIAKRYEVPIDDRSKYRLDERRADNSSAPLRRWAEDGSLTRFSGHGGCGDHAALAVWL